MAKTSAGRFKDLVYNVLLKYPNVRDDTGLLYVACIAELTSLEYVKNISLYDFFRTDKECVSKVTSLPTISSIVRLNTILQKEHPEVRGEEWEKRQRHSKDYKEDLGYAV